MHDIEPYYKWRKHYIASEDDRSPFYGRKYNEFAFSQKIYNYYIHPQWDEIGSNTIYIKIIQCDYEKAYCCIDLIGEWNDAITNDIMFLKREIGDKLFDHGIYRYILFCDNVLNIHVDDDSYYEEWYHDVSDEGGWITFVNLRDHVQSEMEAHNLQNYINFGPNFNNIRWQGYEPHQILELVETILTNQTKQLSY